MEFFPLRVRTEVLGEVSRGRTSGRGATERNWQDLWLVSVTGQLKSLPDQEVRLECSKVRKPREATLFLGGNPPTPSHTLFLVLPSTTRQRWMEPSSYRAGPLGCLHTKCRSTEAQLQRAPWPPSVVAQETFPRSPSEHSATNRTPSEAGLYVQSLPLVQSSLGTSQTLTRGSRTFLKIGIKQPICPSVCVAGGGEGLRQESTCRAAGAPRARGHKGRARRQPLCEGPRRARPPPAPPSARLLSAPSAHTVLPGGWRTGGSGRSTPGFCALRLQPGTRRAEEATALRAPGQ